MDGHCFASSVQHISISKVLRLIYMTNQTSCLSTMLPLQQFASINFGSTPYLEQHECNNGETACTFFQDSFRGFRDETFGLLGECNTTAVLNLSSDEIVFDTNVIEDTYVHGNENYNNNTFIIQSFWFNDTGEAWCSWIRSLWHWPKRLQW